MYKVLLIEDEAIIRKGLRYTFNWEEFNCCVIGEAENGEEGLQLIEQLCPEIIIVDVNMPRLDGISMLSLIPKNKVYSCILLTGYDDFNIAKKAIHLGVTDYLLKPVDTEQLIEAITKAKQKVDAQIRLQQLEEEDNEVSHLKDYSILPNPLPQVQSVYVRKVLNYIQLNYANKFTMKDLETEFEISGTYLNKLFKQEIGYTVNDFLNRYRIQQAMIKMKSGNDKVYQIAMDVGIKDYKYFIMIFKKYTNQTPKQFQSSDGLI